MVEMAILPYLQQIVQQLHSTMANPLPYFLLFLSFLLLVLHYTLKRESGKVLKSPPHPPKLPIIGNLHHLGKLPHRSLNALSKKYGPIMLLHLGNANKTLVISSAKVAGEIMKTHDIVFSNRPRTTTANIFLYGCLDIGFSPYGEYWRQVKKICVLELLSLRRVQSFQFVREEEVAILIDEIRCACATGTSNTVNITEMLMAISNNIISRCVLGQRTDDKEEDIKFGELSRRVMEQFMYFSFGDTYPFLRWMDYLTGLIGRLKSTQREVDAFLDQVIENHRITLRSDNADQFANKDFVYILLHLEKNGRPDIQLSQDKIKAILMDMFVGGSDTTSTTMEWVMTELVKHENVMRKVQEEVRRVVGKKSKVEVADIEQMNYLKCIIKETMRLHPPAPLLVPRKTTAGVELEGYYIPPKTKVFVNAFAIQTDPKIWDRPEEFLPERFEKNSVDLKGQDFQFIAFGGGRRGCPGIAFAAASAEFVLANLLYWFDWNLPEGIAPAEVDMSEINGLTVHKKVPLHIVPKLYSP